MTRAGFLVAAAALAMAGPSQAETAWTTYGGAPGGGHFTPLADITPGNISRLAVAWTYRTGDFSAGGPGHRVTTFEATPILVDDALVFCTPYNRVVALEAVSGRLLWSHEPEPPLDRAYDQQHSLICRGVSQWREPNPVPGAPCQTRIFQGVLDGRLEALDARTGQLCPGFGEGGTIRLNDMPNGGKGVVNVTSPPAVFEDLVIVGSAIGDNQRTDLPSGIIRAFDARSGRERWHWSPIPDELRGRTGAGNVWAPMALDTEKAVVFAPTTSPSPDFWGGLRTDALPGVDAVVALDARTGGLLWQRQTIHHDLWDYDLPAQPTLLTVRRQGRDIPAVAQPTKTGFLWVLDRATGEPVFPVIERAVPASDVPGETASPTQPVPLAPKPVSRQGLAEDDVWGITPIDRALCLKAARALRNDGFLTPPSLRGSVEMPFAGGGTNWGGMAYDPRSRLAILNSMNLAQFVRLFPSGEFEARRAGASGHAVELARQTGAPFGMERGLLISPLGIPCSRPPWGIISAIDLDTGELRWQKPLGAAPVGIGGLTAPAKWGAPNLGGPLVTASGLVFIGATSDGMFRALNAWTGETLWDHPLPFPGVATPMSFRAADGRQFVVIAAGGSVLLASPIGDALVAFALPHP